MSLLVGVDIRLDFLVIVSDRHISDKSILLVFVQRRLWPNCFMAQRTKDLAILSYLNSPFILQYCPSWLRSPGGTHWYRNLLPTLQFKMSKHCFRQRRLSTEEVTINYLNQSLFSRWRIYASLGVNDLMLVVRKYAHLVANLGTQRCIIYIPLHVCKRGCIISIWALI